MARSVQSRKKYSLGSDVDKEAVFDFHYLLEEDTVSYIQEHGKIMFMIRGPPGTSKATLSEMLTTKYPDAAFCCADEYFRNSFNSPTRTKASLTASHAYCEKKARTACASNISTIIVQNTHMRKWEMQRYIDLAASNNYTVIMSITLYRFNVTPEALLANNTDGLDLNYFRQRLRQWEDVAPVLTGWFLCPADASFLLSSTLECLKELVGDGKFCRIFNLFDIEQIIDYFKAKRYLFCLAGYTTNLYEMQKHYLSDTVQDSYGKCFTITILGYYINISGISAIVQVNDEMNHLVFEGNKKYKKNYDFVDHMNSVEINNNMFEHGKTTMFDLKEKSSEDTTVVEEDWEDEDMNISNCSFIHLAQKDEELINIGEMRSEFRESLSLAANDEGSISFTELEDEIKICRLENDGWVIKAPKKIAIKTIFSGLYV